ncbi:MAG: DNA-3-methyladenine glycosylase [Bacillota bacterium]
MNWEQDFEQLSTVFFARDTRVVARELLGTYMVHRSAAGETSGRVVEVEAYLGQGDPSCHSARGKTPRNEVMFGPAGKIYVYRIYGVHMCSNITTEDEQVASAVLFRALEPLTGIPLMQERRGVQNNRDLCRGPGRLVQAMGISMEHNGMNIDHGSIRFYRSGEAVGKITVTPRIGISQAQDLPLRYYLEGNHYISRK